MSKRSSLPLRSLFLVFLVINVIFSWSSISGIVLAEDEGPAFGPEAEGQGWGLGPDQIVKREARRPVVSTEYGQISAVHITDKINGTYLLHFFTLDPNALLLPLLLHADMVFYVHTGSGRLSWTEENDDDLKHADLRRGDVHILKHGTSFFIQSNLETETERQKLRIQAIFANSNNDLREPATAPYSSIRDMVLGFDRNLLRAAFKVSEEVIDELFNGTKLPAIVHGIPKTRKNRWEMEIEDLVGNRHYNMFQLNKKKREGKSLFNIFKQDKDFENCNGWSTTVPRKKLSALRGLDISVFMVNLTTGSMMGPHWNPRATEIAIVLQGKGMVRVVCPRFSDQCRNTSFVVEVGDVFAVPRYHPMAQMAFNNETFVFMGFTTSAKKNHPQFLAGEASVLRTLDKDVLAMSFNVTNTTLDQILARQRDSVILGCVSCAEEEFAKMEEVMEREREEARRRKEEEERRREEEKRKEEEEAARRQEEEERRRQEEEDRKREEEERRHREEEEAAARKREEEEAERRRQEEEEEAARRQEEERQRQEAEEAERRQEEERQREEAEAARRQEEERQREEAESEAARRQEEERQREEAEAARRREEERQRQEAETRRQEEAARQQEEERQRQEAEAMRQEEEAAARREEEERQREETERTRKEEARQREEAAAARREEERQRREAETRRQEEEEAERREEEGRQREEEAERRRQEEEARQSEEEATARREEEERQRRAEEERQREEEREQPPEETRGREEQGGRSEAEEAAEAERRMEEEARREEEAAREHQGETERQADPIYGQRAPTKLSHKRLPM